MLTSALYFKTDYTVIQHIKKRAFYNNSLWEGYYSDRLNVWKIISS